MGRIRTIKPEFPQSESMGRVSRDARLLFIMLWTLVDDSGRTRAASRMLASLLFPYDEDAPSLIDAWLADLEREGCVRLYKVAGQTYLEICNWLNHQKIDKPSKSKIPEFSESSRILANPREHSSGDQGPRIKDQGSRTKDREVDQVPPAAARPPAPVKAAAKSTETWEAYSTAYLQRYGTPPVRNAKVNALLGQLVDRVGSEEAPQVAAFYVQNRNGYYAQRGHSVECLVADAEKLRTEWATGRTVTQAQARQQDRTASNPFLKMLEERDREEAQQ